MPVPQKIKADFAVRAPSSGGDRLPWVAANPNGGFAVAFTAIVGVSDDDARLQTFDALGTTVSGFSISAAGGGIDERLASVAYLTNGLLARVWVETPDAGGGNGRDIYYSVIDPLSLQTVVSRTLVAGGIGDQGDPMIAASTAGGFAIAYADYNVAQGALLVARYGVSGVAIGTSQVNVTTGVDDESGDLRDLSIVGLANGGYALAWGDSSPFETRTRTVTSTGSFSAEATFNPNNLGFGDFGPDVAALADGRYVAVNFQSSPDTAFGQFFTESNVASGALFQIASNVSGSRAQHLDVAGLKDGRFVVVWQDTFDDIRGQIMFADGTPDGAQFVVNAVTSGTQQRPSVEVLADGRFVVAWDDPSLAPDTLLAAIYDPRESGVTVNGTPGADQYVGSGYADAIFTAGGADTVAGAAGADTIFGGDGNDSLTGDGENDLLSGDNGDDTLDGGAGNDTVLGGFGVDVITGGTGVNTLTGGAGDDFYYVSNATDTLTELSGGGNDSVFTFVDFTIAANIENVFSLGTAGILNGNDGDNSLNGGFATVAQYLNGAGGADVLNGSAARDTMLGGGGDDQLFGRAGNDYMAGENGNDSYYVEELTDEVIEAAGAAAGTNDIVYASVNYTLSANVETGFTFGAATTLSGNGLANTLLGVYSAAGVTLNGLAGNDVLYGSNFADNLFGGDNDDTFFGLLGADAFIGGDGNDTYFLEQAGDSVAESANQGIDTIYAAFDYTLLANFEILFLYGAATNGIGNSADNTLIGSYLPGVNVGFQGFGGNDRIIASTGNDSLAGQQGNDTLTGGGGNDTFFYNASVALGIDTITDFTAGAGIGDRVIVTSIFANFASVLAAATEVGGTTTITVSAGNQLILQGVAIAQLNADDFLF